MIDEGLGGEGNQTLSRTSNVLWFLIEALTSWNLKWRTSRCLLSDRSQTVGMTHHFRCLLCKIHKADVSFHNLKINVLYDGKTSPLTDAFPSSFLVSEI